jgi:hypothetical protein
VEQNLLVLSVVGALLVLNGMLSSVRIPKVDADDGDVPATINDSANGETEASPGL